MNNCFFSIIIPTYNRAHILPNTIQSVINQTFSDWELIVVDDGSTDNTKKVVTTLNESRLKYIYQNNAERSAARNKGIESAKGKYICFLDSDDWYEPCHLQILFEKISSENHPKALIFTNCYVFQKGEKSTPEFPEFSDPPVYLLNNPVIPARVCIHSDILKIYKFREDINIVEDQVLWVAIAYNYPVFHIAENTVVYHLHDDNSINIKNNCYKPRLDGLKLLFKQACVGHLIPRRNKNTIIGNCYYGIARHYFYKRKFIKMLVSLFFSIAYSPFSPQNKSKLFMIYSFIFKPRLKEI